MGTETYRQDLRQCNVCGQYVAATALSQLGTCPFCGGPVAGYGSTSPTRTSPTPTSAGYTFTPEPPKRNNGPLIAAIVGAVLALGVLLAVVAVLFGGSEKPVDFAEDKKDGLFAGQAPEDAELVRTWTPPDATIASDAVDRVIQGLPLGQLPDDLVPTPGAYFPPGGPLGQDVASCAPNSVPAVVALTMYLNADGPFLYSTALFAAPMLPDGGSGSDLIVAATGCGNPLPEGAEILKTPAMGDAAVAVAIEGEAGSQAAAGEFLFVAHGNLLISVMILREDGDAAHRGLPTALALAQTGIDAADQLGLSTYDPTT